VVPSLGEPSPPLVSRVEGNCVTGVEEVADVAVVDDALVEEEP
jgi:hypothetical protein